MFSVVCNKKGRLSLRDLVDECKAFSVPSDFNLKGECVGKSVMKRYMSDMYHKCMSPTCKWDWNGDNNPRLELHHKDGDHRNNTLENCILLCPSCHSLTPTYGFKNKHRSTRTYRYYKKNTKES